MWLTSFSKLQYINVKFHHKFHLKDSKTQLSVIVFNYPHKEKWATQTLNNNEKKK